MGKGLMPTEEQSKAIIMKVDKAQAQYEPYGALDGRGCASCRWFSMSSCYIVDGDISPTGKSRFYEPVTPQQIALETMLDFEESEEYLEDIGLLEDYEKQTSSFVDKVKGLFGRGKKQQDQFFPSPTGFKMINDEKMWVAWHTNAYEDKDREYFAIKAIEKDITRMNATKDYPELWRWHIGEAPQIKEDGTFSYGWSTRHGKGINAFTIGNFACVIGTFDDTPIAQKFKEYYRNNPDIELSHGFFYDPAQKREKTYYDYRTFEISTLPGGKAANPYTRFAINTKEEAKEMQLSKEQLENLKEVLGVDALKDIIATGVGANAKMEGVASKSETPAVDLTGFKSELITDIKGLLTPVAEQIKSIDERIKALEAEKQKQQEKQQKQPFEDNRMAQTINDMLQNSGKSTSDRVDDPLLYTLKQAGLGSLFGMKED